MNTRWLLAPACSGQRWMYALLLLCAAALAGVTLVVCESDMILGSVPTPVSVRSRSMSVYVWKDRVYASHYDAFHAAWPPEQRTKKVNGRFVDPPVITIDEWIVRGGYELNYAAGPKWAPQTLAREELWADFSTPRTRQGNENRLLTDMEKDFYRGDVISLVLLDPQISGKRLGVTLDSPNRTWTNWRGMGIFLSWPIVLIAVPLAIALLVIDRLVGSRSRCIASGICPQCAYDLRGSSATHCPECNEALSPYEQTIIDAMLPKRSTSKQD